MESNIFEGAQAGDIVSGVVFDDPRSIDMTALFRDAEMFESRQAWNAAGFHVLACSNNGKIMVAEHAAVQGLLFKKYVNAVSSEDQAKNYEGRVEGAKHLRAFLDEHGLTRIVIPRKWLLKLPRRFSRRAGSHVLVVERLDLISDEATKAAYRRIDPATLAELCLVVFHFRGMDSNSKNIPFTSDGRIAFVDTEHWDRDSSKSYLHQVGEHLTRAGRRWANKIFRQLSDGDDVRVGDIGEGGSASSSSSSSSSLSSSST